MKQVSLSCPGYSFFKLVARVSDCTYPGLCWRRLLEIQAVGSGSIPFCCPFRLSCSLGTHAMAADSLVVEGMGWRKKGSPVLPPLQPDGNIRTVNSYLSRDAFCTLRESTILCVRILEINLNTIRILEAMLQPMYKYPADTLDSSSVISVHLPYSPDSCSMLSLKILMWRVCPSRASVETVAVACIYSQ